MAEQVRIGVIGTSWWADMMYLPSLGSYPNAALHAICGRNRERAEELASKYGIPQVFTDYRSLFEQGGVDAIIVSTPDDLHHEMTLAALDAGLHVLCEKPMALTAQQAQEMYNTAEEAGVKHMVLFTWRWQPHFRYLKDLIDEGYIGRCLEAKFEFCSDFGRVPEYAWRFDGLRSNGIVSDLGAHMIDFARWYVGEISQVNAHLATFVARRGLDGQQLVPTNDSALVTMQFENGAQGVIHVSSVAHMGDQGLELHISLRGDQGALEAKHVFFGSEAGVSLRGVREGQKHFELLAIPAAYREGLTEDDTLEPYRKQSVGARMFVDAILTNQKVSPDFYDGFKVQQLITAALESNRQQAWVSLSA